MQRRRLSTRSFILVALIAALTVLLLRLSPLQKPLATGVTWVLCPLQIAAVNSLQAVGGWFSPDTAGEQTDLKAIQVERNALLVENARLHTQLEETRRAETQAVYLKERQLRFTTARIIGRSLDPTEQVVLIDRGSADGVQENQAVVVENGIFIGRIYDVTASTAQVLLISDRRSRITASVQNEQHSSGILVGELGLAIRLDMVPQDETLAEQQILVTSGLETGIPSGLVLGSLESITRTPTDLFQSASVISPIELDRIQIVSVITE